MATPTIIIGIGSTGLYILENLQRYYYETNKHNKPSNVELIYIETNEDNKPIGTPIGNDISRVYISLDNMSDMIADIKNQCDDPAWLPDQRVALAAGLGAGGIRSCGRLALWGRNQKGDNFRNVINAITRAHANVLHVNNNEDNKVSQPAVFITGSLTGGTGAGIFIDIGYLVRHIIDEVKDLYGLFLLPKEPVVMRGSEVMYGNSYGALRDLHHYNALEHRYDEKWPNGFDKSFEAPPYELVQFISQDYQDGSPAISTLDGLIKMAGLFLFLNVAGIYEKRRERLVDAKGNSLIGAYGTFGLSAIEFPKDEIQEYIASQLSIHLIDRLIDPGEYYLNNQKRSISRASIKQEMARTWDEILESAFAVLNATEQPDLQVRLANDAVRINRGNIKGNKIDYIISLFVSTKNDNYHALVNNNMKAAMNVIIDRIYELVDSKLQTTENLYYAKYVLEDLMESVGRTLQYWRSVGLSSQYQNWDNKLRELAFGCSQRTYKFILEQDTVLRDRLYTILEMMKMHLIIRHLIDLQKHIREGAVKLQGGDHELPKLELFDRLIREMDTLAGRKEETQHGVLTFTKRVDNIHTAVNDTTLPILRVYPSNSFEQECDKAMQVYVQKSGGKVRSAAEVIGNRNLLGYLKERLSVGFNESVYLDSLKAYRLKVEELNCIEDFDIVKYIKQHTDESIRTARRATSPFLKVDKILSPSPYLPRFVVSSDSNDISEVIQALEHRNFSEFEDNRDGKSELTSLKNIVVFYDEKGNFDLIKDLSYIGLMKKAYEEVPGGLADANVTQEVWTANRSAYSTT